MSADALYFPFSEPPAPGELLEVAPGVHWLRMPLPFALDHINLWLLEDGEGWTLVDSGIGTDQVKSLWKALLDGPLAGRPLRRILVTHFHPDHVGLAGWLSRLTGADVWMSEGEYALAQWLHGTSGEARSERQRAFFSRHGLDAEAAAKQVSGGNVYRARVPEFPDHYLKLSDGDALTINGHRWRVVVGRGHSPEHACFYCEELDLLIAGDQVLPSISPNISVTFLNADADPLSDYLDSLQAFYTLPNSVRVLPAHGRVFHGLHLRLAALKAHHDERLQRLLAACKEPKSGVEAMKVLFDRRFGTHELFFAIGESVAHLHHLREKGLVTRQEDAEGVTRFLSNVS
ncbi:MBL fold metallo-hydrolase [Motiliproteus sp. SC1-56]|uniref:MBL fold metallo-hydrolase n=1 Tax=Motiliproteus sp. SC1-56 TaxID=2799565 RepID=UPI001A8E8F84|nr:MBL fold metallo-hydrolase [Motiliproteus sp. SC1-56]